VASSGNRIQAEVRKGAGPGLVLIPGTWGNAQTRTPLVERLDRERLLVCVALAGQDDNWPPPQHPSIPQFSEDVLDLADNLGLPQFFVGGHSLGGMIAIDMLRLCPERILGAISIEGWTHWGVSKDAFQGETSNTLDNGQQRFLQQVRNRLLDRWQPQLRKAYGTMWTKWNGQDTLDTTPIPVLEIWGDRGRPQPAREQMRIPERQNIRLEWITGVSHNLLIEAPQRLAELMNDFTRAISGSASSAADATEKQ
jgi:3-oxoadipate enol-lactonase